MIENIYQAMTGAVPPGQIDSHASDLYVKVTPASTAIVSDYQFKEHVTKFKDAIDGERWYDIPFAYLPWWAERGCR